MAETGYSGGIIIVGSRVILPVDIASIEPNIVIPITGTVDIAGGTIEIGTVQVIVDVATINSVTTVGQIGTILNAPLVTVTGTVTSVSSGTTIVGTILNAPLVSVEGNITASISNNPSLGTILNAPLVTIQGSLATVSQIGTILHAPLITVTGTIQNQSASYGFTNVSSVIKSSPGILYGINVSGESLTAGTLLVMDSTATLVVIPVAAGGFESAPFAPGVGFGTLIASVIGAADATFIYR